MRVLYPASPEITNSYLTDIMQHLNGIDMHIDYALFYDTTKDFDIIHIQWIEALFDWKKPSKPEVNKMLQALQQWKQKGTKIVITKHNEIPHRSSGSLKKATQLCYDYADGVVHLGQYSYKNSPCSNAVNVIIPHSLYENLPNNTHRDECRKQLHIPKNRFVVTCFGAIRSEQEYQFILKAFKSFEHQNKTLLTNKWPCFWYWRRSPFKRLKYEYFKRLASVKKQYQLHHKYIEDQDIQLYLNAADLVFIARIDTLNSGNVPLGFTFKKVVVGPNIGNIGEILRESNNPVFDPGNLDSVRKALQQGVELSKKGHGEENYKLGMKNWNLKSSAQKHMSLYHSLCKHSNKTMVQTSHKFTQIP